MIKFDMALSGDEKKLLERYVEPHNIKSREVVESDLLRVAEEAHNLYLLCFLPRGFYPGGEAIAHPQIDDKDPLRFFVTKEKEIIINPEIINHTKTTVPRFEGCMSFPDLPMIETKRWNKVTVKYQTLKKDGTLSDWMEENINGHRSNIFQHETEHCDGENIYDKFK